MLSVRRVSKRFPPARADEKGYLALDEVELEVADGELVCLLGPSGCGKSTLLNLIAGFEMPTAGEITADGEVVRQPGSDRMVCFQDANAALLPWLTVEENVMFGLRMNNVRSDRRATVDHHLEMVGLAEHRRKFPSQLSGGMCQRLQIARALAIEPRILLMDEPFAALDAITRRRMHGELLGLWSRTQKTIVFVTHDIAEAITLADRVAIMSIGPGSRIIDEISVDLPRPRAPAFEGFGRTYGKIEHSLSHEGVGAA